MKVIEIKVPQDSVGDFFNGIEVFYTLIGGKSLIERTMDRLSILGFEKVYIDIPQPPETLASLLFQGIPWGIEVVYGQVDVDVHPVISPGWNHPSDAMDDVFQMLSDGGREFDLLPSWPETPGVWLSRGVEIDSTVKLIPPCYIGEGVHIGAKSIIGPYACIEKNTYIGDRAEVSESLIQPETMVHSGLKLEHVIADKSKIFDLNNDYVFEVDGDLLGDTTFKKSIL
jgi:NDP-sugar pyrophosphorylase family protein